MMKIKIFHSENFRGIRSLSLPIDGRNVVILGENGTGKSSIVDAIEYYFTGRVEKLMGRQDIKERECVPNLKGGTTTVALTFHNHADPVVVSYPHATVTPPVQLDPFFQLAAKRPFVLRRSQILNFINAADADRYKRILQLIGLESIDSIETVWRRERDTLQKRKEILENQVQQALHQLQIGLGVPAEDRTEVLKQINRRLFEVRHRPIANRREIAERLAELRTNIQSYSKIQNYYQLSELKNRVLPLKQRVAAIEDTCTELTNARIAWLEQVYALDEASFEALLREASYLLAELNPTSCPLCEKPIEDLENLRRRIDQRTSRLLALTNAQKRFAELQSRAVQQINILSHELQELLHDVHVNRLPLVLKTLTDAIDAVNSTKAQIDQEAKYLVTLAQWPVQENARMISDNLNGMDIVISEHLSVEKPIQGDLMLVELVEWLARIDENWRSWQERTTEHRQVVYVFEQVNLVYKEMIAARKRGLERILQELAEEFNKLYEQLHPREGFNGIELPLPGKRDNSIRLQAGFQGKGRGHPLGYFSEGHLDSLGLCIFLSFIKRYNGDLRMIVLDDVLTTVDAGHRIRVAQVLAREFTDYQIIMTTHDELWARELEAVMRNANVSPKLIRLAPWSFEEGTTCSDYIASDFEYYRRQISDGRMQDAIAGTGRALERFLSVMRLNLRLAIPARQGEQYTIGDLYDPFFAWLHKHPIERPDLPDYQERLTNLQEELDDYWRLRNWSGAHYNQWASTITATEAFNFIAIIADVVRLLECPSCGELVVYNEMATILHCPKCKPSPQPRVVWEYHSNWYEQAARLAQQNAKMQKNAVSMAQKAFTRFLRDMRRRLGLMIPPSPDDVYEVINLYPAFTTWLETYPRNNHPRWPQLGRYQATINEHIQSGDWAPFSASTQSSPAFIEAVMGIIGLFQCENCHHLLNYDRELAQYSCTQCNKQEVSNPRSAYWYVIKKA